MEKGQETIGVFDPKNIRSKFAKFDPAKADSSDILAANRGMAPPALSELGTDD